MKLRTYFFLLLLFFSPLMAAEIEQKALIKEKMDSYVDAYNRQDPKALSAFWEEDGQFTHPKTGQVIKGKTEIENFFSTRFEEDGDSKLDVKISSVLIREDDAVATGVFQVTEPEQSPREIAFKAYFEEDDGEWLIQEIRQIDIAEVPDNYQYLKELEWLIGEWIDEDDDAEINISYAWDASKNFIYKKFSLASEGKVELEGTQIIGWDPIKENIHSWTFDTDGTFGESTWTKKEKTWVVENKQTLADGSRGSSIHSITPIDSDSYSWEASNREVGGEILPDISPVIVERKKG